MDDTDNDGDALTGGYLIEIDARRDEDFNFISHHHYGFGLIDPDPPTGQQGAYIQDYINRAEDVLYGDNFTDPQTGWLLITTPTP
jgi:hypothetical protein